MRSTVRSTGGDLIKYELTHQRMTSTYQSQETYRHMYLYCICIELCLILYCIVIYIIIICFVTNFFNFIPYSLYNIMVMINIMNSTITI